MQMTLSKPFFSLKTTITLLFSLLIIVSCKKKPVEIPPPTASFLLRDTLRVDASYANGSFAAIYNSYNGKTYAVSSNLRVEVKAKQTSEGFELFFIDSSVQKLYPSFSVMVKDVNVRSIEAAYTLSNSKVTVNYSQQFTDGSSGFGSAAPALAGKLTTSYNNTANTISGIIENMKLPLEYYVPENISIVTRSANGIILRQQSVRTVTLEFRDIPVIIQ